MYPNAPGFHPQFQQQQQAYQSGPPPAKKAKGNGPVITRYPPPPGYRPPPQQQPYPGQPPFQQHPYGFAPQPVAAAYPGYPPQYAAPQNAYPQPPPPAQYPGYPPQMQHPLPAYPPSAVAYQPAWAQTPQAPPVGYQPPPHSTYQPPPPTSHHQHQRQHSHRNASGTLLDGNGDIMSAPDDPISSDLESEFYGECYFARNPEEIVPELSLGVIEWKAPVRTRRALPSVFKEAELEAIAPRPDPPMDEESVSEYFFRGRREEALGSVRQTEGWREVEGDLIFREFPVVGKEVVSYETMLARYQFRYDAEWDVEEERSPTPERVAPVRAVCERESRERSEVPNSHLDDLEQALRERHTPAAHSRASSVASSSHQHRAHSRASSVASQHHRRPSKRPLPPVRDQTQEELLAALGVEGSPKVVYETPGPAFPAARNEQPRHEEHSRANSVNSAHGRFPVPPPPPPPPGYPPPGRRGMPAEFHPREFSSNGHATERRGSASSCRTAEGSDFGGDEITPRPKRIREEEEDEETPKVRRKVEGNGNVGRGEEAFRRRW